MKVDRHNVNPGGAGLYVDIEHPFQSLILSVKHGIHLQGKVF